MSDNSRPVQDSMITLRLSRVEHARCRKAVEQAGHRSMNAFLVALSLRAVELLERGRDPLQALELAIRSSEQD